MKDPLSLKNTAWQNLEAHYQKIKSVSIQTLFDQDPHRFEKYSGEWNRHIFMDYSKHCFTAETVQLWLKLLHACNVTQALSELNAGKRVNVSENRSALHHELRKPLTIARPEIQETRQKMADWIEKIHRHKNNFTDIVNIGIGGSDLGSKMTVFALSPYYSVTSQRNHFISTLDFHQLDKLLNSLDPQKTIVIISSKSFATQETLINAQTAKNWLGKNFSQQIFAVTENIDAAKAFEVPEDRIFPIWTWVGGRYSIWSAIGFPLAINIGMKNFEDFLSGGFDIDKIMSDTHTPIEKNPAVILALLNIWETCFFKAQTHAILPYDVRLSEFPAYLQQLEMESNGKSVTQTHAPVHYPTGPIIWGETGTNGQHAFHQLLHQGTHYMPVDFILTQKPHHTFYDQHLKLISHGLSQARILMTGQYSSVNYKNLTGNRPSTVILLPELNPYYLGSLIALYEYKVFISALIWDINPFDQWGVESGKRAADVLYEQLKKHDIKTVLKN